MPVTITMPNGTVWTKTPVDQAIRAVMDGQTAMVEWERQIIVKKDCWCQLNINHIQRGTWYVKQDTQSNQNEETGNDNQTMMEEAIC